MNGSRPKNVEIGRVLSVDEYLEDFADLLWDEPNLAENDFAIIHP